MTEATMTPLWDSDHPYYCTQGNFRANSRLHPEVLVTHESWADFAEYVDPELIAMGMSEKAAGGYYNSDPDLNLVFRWDWKRSDPDDYEEDEEVPSDELHLFVVLQRKADLRTIVIRNITHEDEPAIRSWLTERARTIRDIWAPLLDDPAASES